MRLEVRNIFKYAKMDIVCYCFSLESVYNVIKSRAILY